MNKYIKKLFLRIIIIYRKISSYKKYLLPQIFITHNPHSTIDVCKFKPTCSEYMYLSIKKHGIFKGVFLGVKRVIKCHPWSTGGFDPIPE